MSIKYITRIIGLMAVMMSPFQVHADVDAEKKVLASIVHELKALEPLIAKAEQQTDSKERVQFKYIWLKQDIKRIIDGIENHIDSPRYEPRKFEPLQGDYRR